jgi:hypothetical protein
MFTIIIPHAGLCREPAGYLGAVWPHILARQSGPQGAIYALSFLTHAPLADAYYLLFIVLG